jgi:hypothetical protein
MNQRKRAIIHDEDFMGLRTLRTRLPLAVAFALALGYAQFRDAGLPQLAAHLEIVTVDASTGNAMPARIYLNKGERPFRLTPVEALLPLVPDVFYRDRVWRASPKPRTIEVTCKGRSHVLLTEGRAVFDLPAATYRVEAYRGTFYQPAAEQVELHAGEARTLVLKLAPVAGNRRNEWLSGDDHIHLTREASDDDVFLAWIQAEDLNVANFLQLQRQMDAAVQYAFGRGGEARAPRYSVRSGHESRSSYYGHMNVLGPREMVRPLSVGTMYGNSVEAYPYPLVLFDQARRLHGATVGYAHFDGGASGNQHSTFLMDLALGALDFTEVFQSGVLRTEEWYQILNAGFRLTGIAGSDFPVSLNNRSPWPGVIPLLGPERTLVRARAGESAYESWAAGIHRGEVVVSNGPLLEFEVNGRPIGSRVLWDGQAHTLEGEARAWFHRPIEKLEIVVNGRVVAERQGDGAATHLTLPFRIEVTESSWAAARVNAESLKGEPDLRAHTNAIYFERGGAPALVPEDREALARKWEAHVAWYKNAGLVFLNEDQRRELFSKMDSALAILRSTPEPR